MISLLWLIVGGVVGWLAALIMRDNNGVIVNIIVGIVGAFLGGLIMARGDINNSPLTIGSFAVSLLGAVILLGVVNFVRRGTVRN
nr:GlsB/YeaQ/YmgE family stress response membrane protein [Polymorphobacter sp.]